MTNMNFAHWSILGHIMISHEYSLEINNLLFCSHYSVNIESPYCDDWSEQIGKTILRVSLGFSPWGLIIS